MIFSVIWDVCIRLMRIWSRKISGFRHTSWWDPSVPARRVRLLCYFVKKEGLAMFSRFVEWPYYSKSSGLVHTGFLSAVILVIEMPVHSWVYLRAFTIIFRQLLSSSSLILVNDFNSFLFHDVSFPFWFKFSFSCYFRNAQVFHVASAAPL